MTVFIIPNNQYETIQSAINAAEPGDEIKVLPGKYDEHLSIFGKDNLTVTASNYDGSSSSTTQVILENSHNEGIAINIDADNTKIYGIRIFNYDIGINIIGNSNTLDNIDSNCNNIGCSIEGNCNLIQTCSCESSKLAGLYLQGKYNQIVCSRFSNNLKGICSFGSIFMGNIFFKNMIFQNIQYNIRVSSTSADKNIYRENTISDSIYGLLNDTGRIAALSNIFINNSNLGISYQDNRGIIINNTLLNNNAGMYLNTSQSIIAGNTLEQGSSLGIQITGNQNYVIQNSIQLFNSTGLLINGSKNILSNNSSKNNYINQNVIGSQNYLTKRYTSPSLNNRTNSADYKKMLDIFK